MKVAILTQVILPIFLAWFIKSIIMSVGGSQGYRKARPFFIGLILGHFRGAGTGQGHNIPFSDWWRLLVNRSGGLI